MARETLEYLAGSANRLAVLRVLGERGPLSPRGLEDRVDASRRTLKRVVDGLASRGWVIPADEGYELTALGRATLAAYESFRERQRSADRLAAFLRNLPARTFDVGVDALTDTNLVVASNADPYGPVDRLLDLRADADRVRECAPYLLADSVDQFHDRLVESTPPTVTLVLGASVPPSVDRAPTYRERFDALLGAATVDVYRRAGGVPFPFGVADGRAFVVSLADDRPRAIVDGTDPDLVGWAERRVDAYVSESNPMGEGGGGAGE